MNRCEDRMNEMNIVHKYIIDISPQHRELLNILLQNRLDKDLVRIEFADMLDTIMGTAYALFTGDVRGKNMDDLYTNILTEFFSKLTDGHIIEYICSKVEYILNGFLLYLVELGISTNRVLFVENITNNGIFISEYDVTHLRVS